MEKKFLKDQRWSQENFNAWRLHTQHLNTVPLKKYSIIRRHSFVPQPITLKLTNQLNIVFQPRLTMILIRFIAHLQPQPQIWRINRPITASQRSHTNIQGISIAAVQLTIPLSFVKETIKPTIAAHSFAQNVC